jgi:hypothetical protein
MDRIYADADSGRKNEECPDQQPEQPTPAVAELLDWVKICQQVWTDGRVSEEDWKWMEQLINECCKVMKG